MLCVCVCVYMCPGKQRTEHYPLSDEHPLGRGKGTTPPTSYPPMLGRPSHQATLLVPHHSQLDTGITTESLRKASRPARFTESAPATPPPIRDKLTAQSVTPSASTARFRRFSDGFSVRDSSPNVCTNLIKLGPCRFARQMMHRVLLPAVCRHHSGNRPVQKSAAQHPPSRIDEVADLSAYLLEAQPF